MNHETALNVIRLEYAQATSKFPPFHSCHEGYAVLQEEVDELWDEVRRNPKDMARIKKEAVQVGAMALRFLVDCCAAEPITPADAECEHKWIGLYYHALIVGVHGTRQADKCSKCGALRR